MTPPPRRDNANFQFLLIRQFLGGKGGGGAVRSMGFWQGGDLCEIFLGGQLLVAYGHIWPLMWVVQIGPLIYTS